MTHSHTQIVGPLPATALRAIAEEQRLGGAATLNEARRGKLGQFFTPWSIAYFMAGLVNQWRRPLHLLDAGAGTGVLCAAWVAKLCEEVPAGTSAEITAFEVASELVPSLEATLRACEEFCNQHGVSLSWNVRNEDFIQGAVNSIQADCLSAPLALPTVAVLNPPYGKIGNHSKERRLLRSVGIEATNSYAAFVALALKLLEHGSELVAITPRSFCNGPYFRSFRKQLLKSAGLRHLHVFERRDAAFREADVLQENIVVSVVKGGERTSVSISQSPGGEMQPMLCRRARFEEVVHADDRESFIHVAADDEAHRTAAQVLGLGLGLDDIDLKVSTGRVVDFRARERLRAYPEPNTVPLIYPQHFRNGFVFWPKDGGRKPNALDVTGNGAALVVPNGTYVLVKRFSAKEEAKRVVAAVFAPERIPTSAPLAFENHLNYFHAEGAGLSPTLARGLAAYLNSSLVDSYFRQFSGHTQVNATDLRRLRYPPPAVLSEIGRVVGDQELDQDELDRILEEILAASLGKPDKREAYAVSPPLVPSRKS